MIQKVSPGNTPDWENQSNRLQNKADEIAKELLNQNQGKPPTKKQIINYFKHHATSLKQKQFDPDQLKTNVLNQFPIEKETQPSPSTQKSYKTKTRALRLSTPMMASTPTLSKSTSTPIPAIGWNSNPSQCLVNGQSENLVTYANGQLTRS